MGCNLKLGDFSPATKYSVFMAETPIPMQPRNMQSLRHDLVLRCKMHYRFFTLEALDL